jgi:outer membrane lipoprotein-sorting protein
MISFSTHIPSLIIGVLFWSLFFTATQPVRSQTPEEKGLIIAVEADRRYKGFGDYTSDMKMILKNKQGKESRRTIRSRILEVVGDGNKSLSIFDTPRDVKGTAFLSFSHKVGDDEQWLYLPALKRVKRINSRNKSGSFMGSEFAYEDIVSQEVEKYTYKHLREEEFNGTLCFVGESYPVDKRNSGYTKRTSWTDTDEYLVQKVEFYDRKQSLLKTLTIMDYQHYLGKFWRPSKMEMINHQTGKSTILLMDNYQFQTGLTDKDFNSTSLKRIR